MLLVGGGPGAGKTVLACHFLSEGIKRGEQVAYVSFIESEKAFRANAARMGFNFDTGNFAFLEFFTGTAGAVSAVLDALVTCVQAAKPRRLVIDSFSSLSDSLRDQAEVRRILHNVLAKAVCQAGVTVMLVAETPLGASGTGEPSAEFISDGIIMLRQRLGKEPAGSMEILKMRGCAIRRREIDYAIEEKGIAIAEPLGIALSPLPREKGTPHGERRRLA